jgi:hypothetical protein
MFRSSVVRCLALPLLLGAIVAVAGEKPAAPEKKATPVYRLAGPFTHDNLTIYLIRGEETMKGRTFLTLDEALAQKKVIVHETQNVNQLAIENVSASDEVFVQAGDIVKGGQQDRTIAIDLIVAPKSGKVPLASFCVESGRWTGRAGEAAGFFAMSKDQLSSNNQKLAARKGGSQREVWDKVAEAQRMLTANVKADVKDPKSASSLQLTLEHKKLLEAIDGHIKKLNDAPEGKEGVIGFAVCINGKVNNADIYAANSLFLKLWPKLLKAAAVEAVAEQTKDGKFTTPKDEEVLRFLADAEKGKINNKEIDKRLLQQECENDQTILFQTRDRGSKAAPAVRSSYIRK